MAQRQEANVPLLMTIGAVSGFLLLVLAIGTEAWFLREVQHETAIKWDNAVVQPLTDQRGEQLARISNYRWADKEKTRIAIPIDQAMKIVAGRNSTTAPSAKAE
jgi:hypothetical protein